MDIAPVDVLQREIEVHAGRVRRTGGGRLGDPGRALPHDDGDRRRDDHQSDDRNLRGNAHRRASRPRADGALFPEGLSHATGDTPAEEAAVIATCALAEAGERPAARTREARWRSAPS